MAVDPSGLTFVPSYRALSAANGASSGWLSVGDWWNSARRAYTSADRWLNGNIWDPLAEILGAKELERCADHYLRGDFVAFKSCALLAATFVPPGRALKVSMILERGVVSRATVKGINQGFAVGQGFRSFSQFKRVLGPAGPGKEWHHVVEQTSSNVGHFGPGAVHNTGNLVRLDADVHRQISAYYSSKDFFTGGQTIRQWLSGQSYAAQQEFGRRIMARFGA